MSEELEQIKKAMTKEEVDALLNIILELKYSLEDTGTPKYIVVYEKLGCLFNYTTRGDIEEVRACAPHKAKRLSKAEARKVAGMLNAKTAPESPFKCKKRIEAIHNFIVLLNKRIPAAA